MMSSLEKVFSKVVEQLDREDRRLTILEQSAQEQGLTFDRDGFYAVNRALSYVVMGGVLEEMMRELPDALAADVISLGVQHRHLPPSILAVVDAAMFRQCGLDNVSALLARTAVVQAIATHHNNASPVVDFSKLLKLADGKTVGEKNFQAIWAILDLPGDWKNSPNDSLLLREIHDKRNSVAHWNEDLVALGRTKRASDLRAMVNRLKELVEHFYLSMWVWLESRAEMRFY